MNRALTVNLVFDSYFVGSIVIQARKTKENNVIAKRKLKIKCEMWGIVFPGYPYLVNQCGFKKSQTL